jgi:hypothetical protein
VQNEEVKLGSGHGFVVLGTDVKVFTPINGCHTNANFAWTPTLFILVKRFSFFLFVLANMTLKNSHQPFNLNSGHILIYEKFLAYMYLEI